MAIIRWCAIIAVVLAAFTAQTNARIRHDFVKRCISDPQLPTDTNTRYVIEGTTSGHLHADDIFQHEFSSVERTIACNFKLLMTRMSHKTNKIWKKLPKPMEPANLPGEVGVTRDAIGANPKHIDGVALDLESGLMTIDTSFSGMLMGFKPHEMPVTMHTTGATLRVTIHFIIDKSNGVHLKAQDVAVKMMMAESPELITAQGWKGNWMKRKMLHIINFMIKSGFNEVLDRVDDRPADMLAKCLRRKINMGIGMFDISFLHPEILEKMFTMSKAVDKAAGAVSLVQKTVSS